MCVCVCVCVCVCRGEVGSFKFARSGQFDFQILIERKFLDCLVGCFGLISPLRQYFNLYRTVFQTGRKKREQIDERKMSKTTQPEPTARAVGP